MQTVKELLNRAADILEKDGWIQNRTYGGNGRCIIGAVVWVSEAGPECLEIECRAIREICKLIGCTDIPAWNDAPGRDAHEVITTLRKAAENADD